MVADMKQEMISTCRVLASPAFTEVIKKYIYLKGQSHEKVGEMSLWGISLGPN
jgi:hypothetical protein